VTPRYSGTNSETGRGIAYDSDSETWVRRRVSRGVTGNGRGRGTWTLGIVERAVLEVSYDTVIT
jgi:hypothetical protein